MNNQETIKVLNQLSRVTEAGEKGFAAASVYVINPGLKAHFKSYAQQRATLHAEILAEINRLNGSVRPRSSIWGAVHRGGLVLTNAVSFENRQREQMMLKEVLMGESYAIRAYEQALKADLPAETEGMLRRHLNEIDKTDAEIRLFAGQDGKQMWVRQYANESDARTAVDLLNRSGRIDGPAEHAKVGGRLHIYDGRHNPLHDTTVSGAALGFVLGALFAGLLALGAGIVMGASSLVPSGGMESVIFIVLGAILVFGLLGALFGLILGAGAVEDDHHQYRETAQQRPVVVRAVTNQGERIKFE